MMTGWHGAKGRKIMAGNSRRGFLQESALGAAALALAGTSRGAKGANDRVTVGLIGCGGMGTAHLRQLVANADVNIAYVCDPDGKRLGTAAQAVEKASRPAARTVKDLRQILDD